MVYGDLRDFHWLTRRLEAQMYVTLDPVVWSQTRIQLTKKKEEEMGGNVEKCSASEWELKKKKAIESLKSHSDSGSPDSRMAAAAFGVDSDRGIGFVGYARNLKKEPPQSGVVWYVHYQSGQIYRIIKESQYHDDVRSGTPVVTYQNVATDQCYTTPYDRFFGNASKLCNQTNQKVFVPRFTPIAVPVDLSGCLSTLNAAIRMLDGDGVELPESYRAKVLEAKAQLSEVLENLKIS